RLPQAWDWHGAAQPLQLQAQALQLGVQHVAGEAAVVGAGAVRAAPPAGLQLPTGVLLGQVAYLPPVGQALGVARTVPAPGGAVGARAPRGGHLDGGGGLARGATAVPGMACAGHWIAPFCSTLAPPPAAPPSRCPCVPSAATRRCHPLWVGPTGPPAVFRS